jgi:hypothetical protein
MPYIYVVGNGIMLLFVTYVIPLSIILYNYLRIIQFVYHWKIDDWNDEFTMVDFYLTFEAIYYTVASFKGSHS